MPRSVRLRRLPPLALAALLLAGCVGGGVPPAARDGPAGAAPAGLAEAFAAQAGHDHARAQGHGFAWGLEPAFVLPLAQLLGGEEGLASDVQFHGDLAAVAVNGGSGGFVLLDASEPPALRVLGRYRSGSEDNWYVKFTPDGRRVVLTANGGLDPLRALGGLAAGVAEGTAAGPVRGLQVVDVSDPAAPRLVGAYPAPVRVINAATFEREGVTYVAASVVEDRAPTGPHGVGVSNRVVLLRLAEEAGGAVSLREVARWAPDAPAGDAVFPHDLAVQEHPADGRALLYAAWWDAGGWIVDVTDPARPATLAALPGREGDHVHTVKPHPGLVEGRHLVLASPESFGGERPGAYRLFDATDPGSPLLLDEWEIPGDLANEAPLLWSPHEFTLADGKAYVSQFHGGAGVLGLRGGKLAPLAWWAAAFPGLEEGPRWSLDVETFVRHGDYAYTVDMGGGVMALRETA